MKRKIYVLVFFIFLLLFLVSCVTFSKRVVLNDQKDEIVMSNFGELEYIVKRITIYKGEKGLFDNVDGIDYIIKNSGDRGSVSPTFYKNFYLYIDLVKKDNQYKLLIYNNIMKKNASKEKMFILTNYFLPIDVYDLKEKLEGLEDEHNLEDFTIAIRKKDSEVEDFRDESLGHTHLERAYHESVKDKTYYMTMHNGKTDLIVVGTSYNYYIASDSRQEIYYPLNKNYLNIVDGVYDTLNDKELSFSSNEYRDFLPNSLKLESFEIVNEQINDEICGKIFFYAETYKGFERQLNELGPRLEEYSYQFDLDFYIELLNIYDEEFFIDNSLLFYYKEEGNVSENYVHSVTIKDDTLTLNVNRFEGTATAISTWLEIVSVSKEDLVGVNEIDLIVRTIMPETNSLYIYIDSVYAKEFYVDIDILKQFEDLENVKEIDLFRTSLLVNLKVDNDITEEKLLEIKGELEKSANVINVYMGRSKSLLVSLEPSLYDKYFDETISINDLIEDEKLINKYEFSLDFYDTIPFSTLNFYLEDKGLEQARELLRTLQKMDLLWLKSKWAYIE